MNRAPDIAKGRCRTVLEPLESRVLLSATYYISPSGNDANAGTSPAAPWLTVAKVDASAFSPGDQILFQRGGQWRESLNASSSGTVADPITCGAYCDANQPNPLFIGSDVLNNAAFTLLSGTTSTYSMTTTAVNWIFDNHTFTHHSKDALGGSGDFTTNLNYVNSTPGSWYQSGTTLYVNVGGSLDGHVLTAAMRADAVYSNLKNNLVFSNLDVTETAQDNAGYAFRVFKSSNVQILSCNASLAGKHHFGVIDSTGFVGQNLVASYAAPDLNYGGASAFVSYSDATRLNDTSQWIDCTWQNPNGPYPAFISHGDATNAISTLLIKNMNCPSGWGTGMVIYSTGPAEQVTIEGGSIHGTSVIQLDTSNSSITGMTVTGNSYISINGSHTVVQNCTFTGKTVTPNGGYDGYVVDGGQYNTIQFNTFTTSTYHSNAIGVLLANSNTTSLGNIFNCPNPYTLFFLNSNGTINSNDNLFIPNSYVLAGNFSSGPVNTYTFAQWQSQFDEDSRALIATNAQLDLASNSLIVHDGNLAAIDFFLSSGFDNGKWDGLGIISSTAAQDASYLTSVGAILNDDGTGTPIYTTFNGQSATATDVLLKYTYFGDSDLSGHVDGTDYSLIDHGFNTPNATGWSNGDFNYDGKIDGSDYSLIDNAFNMQGAALPSALSQAELSSAVPGNAVANKPAPRIASTGISPATTGNLLAGIFSDHGITPNDGLLKYLFG